MQVTIGNDVEFILTGKRGPVSSIGMVGGTKSFPSPCDCGALQEDNVLAEINIHPAKTSSEWETNITTVIRELKSRLPFGVVISKKASAFYGPLELINPKALEFGCDPDINAWSQRVNKFKELDGKMAALRSAGGHVHVGISELTTDKRFELIQCMDAFIGLQAVLLDKDTQRKELYGKAGAMRMKPYGVEWRVPSNFWVHSKYNRKWMFDAAMFCSNNFSEVSYLYHKVDIVNIINENNKKAALKELKQLHKHVQFPLHKILGG